MRIMSTIIVALSLVGAASAGSAQSDLDKALADGASIMTSDEIAALLVGSTVTARAGEKMFTFQYGTDNVLSGEMAGGGWSDSGYYGITDGDRVCLSMTPDKGRLRCLTLIRDGEGAKKYSAAGKMTFELLKIEPAS